MVLHHGGGEVQDLLGLGQFHLQRLHLHGLAEQGGHDVHQGDIGRLPGAGGPALHRQDPHGLPGEPQRRAEVGPDPQGPAGGMVGPGGIGGGVLDHQGGRRFPHHLGAEVQVGVVGQGPGPALGAPQAFQAPGGHGGHHRPVHPQVPHQEVQAELVKVLRTGEPGGPQGAQDLDVAVAQDRLRQFGLPWQAG